MTSTIGSAFALEPDRENPTPSQPTQRPHHITINALFDYTIVRDKVVSPLLYHDLEGGLTLGYEYRAVHHEHRVLLHFMGGTLTRPGLEGIYGRGAYKNTFPLLMVQLAFEYSFAIPVVRNKKWQFAVGGMFAASAEARAYSHMWTPPVVSFSSTWDIGPSILATWKPAEKHNLRFRLTMPIMSIVKRPLWNLASPKMEADLNKNPLIVLYANPRVTSIHEWLRLSFEFKHEWEITKLLQLNTVYESTLLISNLPRFFGMLGNQVSIGLSFRL